MGDTSIRVSEELADELYGLKNRGDTYEDVIWRLIDDASDASDGDDDGDDLEPAPPGRREFGVRDEPEPTPADEPEAADEREIAEKRIQELDLPGSGAAFSIRAAAALRMYDYLRDNPGDRVGKGELKELFDGDDVGYKGGFRSFWGNWIKKNESQGRPANTLTELPGVEMRGDDYVYSG